MLDGRIGVLMLLEGVMLEVRIDHTVHSQRQSSLSIYQSFCSSTMASWAALPAEIKLLVLRHYVTVILEYNLSAVSQWFYIPAINAVRFAVNEMSNLALALPGFRVDIMEYFHVVIVDDASRLGVTGDTGKPIEPGNLGQLREYWRDRAGQAFCDDMELFFKIYEDIEWALMRTHWRLVA